MHECMIDCDTVHVCYVQEVPWFVMCVTDLSEQSSDFEVLCQKHYNTSTGQQQHNSIKNLNNWCI